MQSTDEWNFLAQDVDVRRKELLTRYLGRQHLLDAISNMYDQLQNRALAESIADVSKQHGLDEATVRQNYFYGNGNES